MSGSALSKVPKTKAKGHRKKAEAAGTIWNAKWHQVRPKYIIKKLFFYSSSFISSF